MTLQSALNSDDLSHLITVTFAVCSFVVLLRVLSLSPPPPLRILGNIVQLEAHGS